VSDLPVEVITCFKVNPQRQCGDKGDKNGDKESWKKRAAF